MTAKGFPAALRRLRRAAGLSLAELGQVVSYSSKTIWSWEVGSRNPHPDVVMALDDALRAGGHLVALHAGTTVEQPEQAPDWTDRVDAGESGRVRPDSTMLGHLANALASQRFIEDGTGAGLVVPATLGQLTTVETLRARASGTLRRDMLSLEAQYAQFLGWCHQDLGDRAASEQWYARALMAAHEADDDNMIASVLSMRSNAAWGAGEVERAVDLAEAAARPAGATPGVLALSHQQAARAHGKAGDRTEAKRALDTVASLAQQAAANPDREPPWIYFFDEDRFEIQRALVLRELGDYQAAAGLFRQALKRLPESFRRDRAVYLARLAQTLALAGEHDEARSLAAEGRQLAEETGSQRTLDELAAVDGLVR